MSCGFEPCQGIVNLNSEIASLLLTGASIKRTL
jgi:hypothetical protein